MTDGPAFFRAIEADPDDDTPRLVYADWLDENAADDADRARAEFVRVQCALARDPDPAALREREQRLLAEFGPAWAAAWPFRLQKPVYRRGFLDPVVSVGSHFPRHADRLVQLTPLTHLRLLRTRGTMGAVAACPHLAAVSTLTLTTAVQRNADMTALAASPHLGNLRHLDLSHNKIGLQGATDLAAAAAPALRALDIRANPIRDGGLLALAAADWPALERLNATQCGLRTPGVSGLAASPLAPRLVSLELARNPEVPTAAWLRLAEAPFHRLESLDLNNPAVTDEVVHALAANPAVTSLRVLHLGGSAVTAEGARMILTSPNLRGLTRLYLTDGHLDLAHLEQLRADGDGFNPG